MSNRIYLNNLVRFRFMYRVLATWMFAWFLGYFFLGSLSFWIGLGLGLLVGWVSLYEQMVCEHCGKMLPKSKAGVPTVCSKCGQPTDAAK